MMIAKEMPKIKPIIINVSFFNLYPQNNNKMPESGGPPAVLPRRHGRTQRRAERGGRQRDIAGGNRTARIKDNVVIS